MSDQVFPSDFTPKGTDLEKTAQSILGYRGKCLGSKSHYRYNNPLNLIVFNANVFAGKQKIWHGDLDITLNSEELVDLAKALNKTIYVIYEHKGRFGEEDTVDLTDNVVEVTSKGITLNKTLSEYYVINDEGTIKEKHKELLKESDFLPPIKVNLLKLDPSDKERSPHFQLLDIIIKKIKLNRKTQVINDFRVYLNEDDYNMLGWLTKKWLQKFETGDSVYLTNRVFNEMTGFGLGFNHFSDKRIGLFHKSGHVYVMKSAIEKKPKQE